MLLVLFRGSPVLFKSFFRLCKTRPQALDFFEHGSAFPVSESFLHTLEDCCETHFLHSCPFKGFHIEMFSKTLYLSIKLKSSENSGFINSQVGS